MKKYLLGLLAMAFIISLSAFTGQPAANKQHTASEAKQTFMQLVWYYDNNKTSPVGSTAEPATEIQRLEDEFPANTFSTSSGPGLSPYEYGFQSSSDPNADAVIYSDL